MRKHRAEPSALNGPHLTGACTERTLGMHGPG
jgi:hypothetical protein